MIRKAIPTKAPHFGPADHNRRVTEDELERATWQGGFRYEVIDGRLYVSPTPNMPTDCVEFWLMTRFILYTHARPDVVNYMSRKARVFVPGRPELTVPEPDFALYHNLPLRLGAARMDWKVYSPVLVAEVLTESDPDKDTVRNVELYLEVPSIREYWIVDPRADADRPSLSVYRRRGSRWQKPITVPPGGTYATKLLPDFSLTMDIHA